jgi:hypothetical protein
MSVTPEAEPPDAATPGGPPDWVTAGPPAWALGAALLVSGNIFQFWAERAPGPGLSVTLALLGLVLRLLGLGLLIRWVLPFRTWWAYVLAALLAAGMATAVLEALAHVF